MLFVACAMPPPLTPQPIASRDPLITGELDALHVAAEHTLSTLVAALTPAQQARLGGLTLAFDGGDVNAYATCSGSDLPLVIVTDSLLELARQLAVARAYDETYGTDRVHDYATWRANHPDDVAPLAADRRTLDEARVLFTEELAYVIGHELGHHYLGHLNCGGFNHANPIRLFDQADELASDAAGIKNTLATGLWSEAGAVLVLQFFRTEQTLEQVALAFEQTHPLAEIRLPTVTATADLWRMGAK